MLSDPAPGVTYSGFVNGETSSVLGGTLSVVDADAAPTTGVGSYAGVDHGVRADLDELHDHLRCRQSDGHAGSADDHGRQHHQDLWANRDSNRHRFTTSGLVNSDTVTSVSLSSPGAAATATVAGSPYAIVASGAVGSGLGELHDQLRQRQPDGEPGAADDHGQQHDQDLWANGDVRGHGVHDERAGQQRHGVTA